jgi:hypothetical protein
VPCGDDEPTEVAGCPAILVNDAGSRRRHLAGTHQLYRDIVRTVLPVWNTRRIEPLFPRVWTFTCLGVGVS